MTVKVRFAPSPTGHIHIGNTRAALYNYLFTRSMGGAFVWRSDDTDRERSTKEFEDRIALDLKFLDFEVDEFVRQSQRFDLYNQAVAVLKKENFLYPCFETTEELDRMRKLKRARGLPPIYDRSALKLNDIQIKQLLAEGRKPHYRFKLSRTNIELQDEIRGNTIINSANLSDPILIRENGEFLYTLPSCVDDLDLKITHVIRGEDHLTNTAVQVEIFKALKKHLQISHPMPKFAHHSLITDEKGDGFSKRIGSLAIGVLRKDGFLPMAINSLLARLGTSHMMQATDCMDELIKEFSFKSLSRAPARFSLADLANFNAKLLSKMSFTSLQKFNKELTIRPDIWEMVQGNITNIKEAEMWQNKIDLPLAPVIVHEDLEFCQEVANIFSNQGNDDYQELIAKVKEQTKRQGKGLFMPIRLALTGLSYGPEIDQFFIRLTREKIIARLNNKTL